MRPFRLAAPAVIALLAGAACGSDDPGNGTGGSRTVPIAAVDFAFTSDAAIAISAGETIDFVVSNDGTVVHQMEVLTDANSRLGTTARIDPGRSDTVTVTFDEPGVYRVICDVDDHRSLGQVAEFIVVDAPTAR